MVAVSANAADLYICGDGAINGTVLAWEPATPYVVAPTANGNYEFYIANTTQVKISTAMGSWSDFNTKALCVEDDFKENIANKLISGEANIVFPWTGDWTVTIPQDLSTITVTTTTPKPQGYTKLYLVGSISSIQTVWDFADENEMTTTDGIIYTIDNVTFAPGNQFKIAGRSWNPNYGAAGSLTVYPGTEYDVVGGSNPDNITASSVPYTGKVSFDREKLKLILGEFAGVEDITVDNNVAPIYYNLQGVRIDNPENGLFIEVRGNKTAKVLK